MDNPNQQSEATQPSSSTDPSVSKPSYGHNWKKWIIITCVLILLIIISVPVFVLGYFQNRYNEDIKKIEQKEKLQQQSQIQDETANWKTYTNKKYKYSLKHPPSWKILVTPLQGESLFQIQSPSFVDDYQSFFIEVLPQSSTSLEVQQEVYSRMGLLRSDSLFNNIAITKFSGVSTTRTVDGRIVSQPIQQAFLLFKKNGDFYTIGYTYDGDKINPNVEDLFNQILSTFQFTE